MSVLMCKCFTNRKFASEEPTNFEKSEIHFCFDLLGYKCTGK